MLFLLLLVAAPSPAKEPIARPVTLARLTPIAASRLDGCRAVFHIELDSGPETQGEFVRADCVGKDPSVSFRVWFPNDGRNHQDTMTVRGMLQVIWHKPSKTNPDGFVEYRLMAE